MRNLACASRLGHRRSRSCPHNPTPPARTQIAAAVQQLHAAGLIHGELRPENVLVCCTPRSSASSSSQPSAAMPQIMMGNQSATSANSAG